MLPARRRTLALAAGGAALALAALAVPILRSYRADLAEARRRVATGARIARTRMGPVQYADEGTGPPVLAIHGAGGGFDQGLLTARGSFTDPHRIIAPSRFGYLGTPLPPDASPAAQADAHAALLDVLGIDQVAVVAHSAGAPSAMQLALRHPERTSCLVLVVPGTWAPPADDEPEVGTLLANPLVKYVAMKADFPLWAFSKLAPTAMIEFLGVPRHLQAQLDARERASILEVVRTILPLGPRLAGIENESRVFASLERLPLEEIHVPTLIIDAEDVSTFRGSAYTAAHVPGAALVRYAEGGHLLVGHDEEVRSVITEFVGRHPPTAGLHPRA